MWELQIAFTKLPLFPFVIELLLIMANSFLFSLPMTVHLCCTNSWSKLVLCWCCSWSEKIYCISSATENIEMEVSLKMPIFFLFSLTYNGISIIIFSKAPDLKCIFRRNWSWTIFICTSSTSHSVLNIRHASHSILS